MGLFAAILGILGGLCAVMGIVTAAGVVPLLDAAYTDVFWLRVSGILFLATIACALSRGRPEPE